MKSVLFALIATIVTLASNPAQARFRIRENCERETCRIYVHVSIAEQLAYVYVDGDLKVGYPVSTGKDGHDTDDFEGHPYAVHPGYHRSTLYPQGDYFDPVTGENLGNMPYAIMFNGPEGIHGTPKSNFAKIGRQASHGCVRMYPEFALELNRAILQVGKNQTWIWIDRHRVGSAQGQGGG